MIVFVCLLLLALITLIVKIGSREKQLYKDDTFDLNTSISENTVTRPNFNLDLLNKHIKNLKQKLRKNKIDASSMGKTSTTPRAYSIQEETEQNNQQQVDTTSI